MPRILRLLLAMLILVNHGLVFAHAHAVEPDDHSLRPHFHLGTEASHAEHSHGGDVSEAKAIDDGAIDDESDTRQAALENAWDHEATAIYFVENVSWVQSSRVVSIVVKSIAASDILPVSQSNHHGLLGLSRENGRSTILSFGACPIYLRTHSLRI